MRPDERVALIVGGAWGVGNLQGATRRWRPCPACGRSSSRATTGACSGASVRTRCFRDAVVFGFTDLMPALMRWRAMSSSRTPAG